MHTNQKIVFLLLFTLLLCMIGCEIVGPDGKPITQPTRSTVNDWNEMDLDSELRHAIEGRSSGILWRISEEFRPEGIASVRPYTALDCAALWPELKVFVFPEIIQSAEMQQDGSTVLEYTDGEQSFFAWVNTSSLYLEDIPQERVPAVLEQIAKYLEKKSGFDQRQWIGIVPENQWLSYGIVIDGIFMDVKTDSPNPVSCFFAQPDGTIVLLNPIRPGAPQETFALQDCLSLEELRNTAETGWESSLSMVMELTECSLIYYLDSDEMTIRPGWSLTGTGYDYGIGKMTPVEMLIDAITGDIKRMR